MGLAKYRKKRDFERTPEPKGRARAPRVGGVFVVQEHDATRLHYDVRLELDGVLKSWAVPKGPCLDPAVRRLAVHVEDHPLDYATFEGVIPEGEYGGGPVLLWDRGRWEPVGDARRGYRAGRLRFRLHGEKLRGGWSLVRMRPGAQEREDGESRDWLLVKARDDEARGGRASRVTSTRPESVATGRSIDEVRAEKAPRRRARAASALRRATPRDAVRRPASRRKSARGPRVAPPRLDGARRAALPARPLAQLATLVDAAPDGDDWLHEIKFDGYRILARLDRGRVRLVSRNGHDWTDRFPTVASAVRALPARDAVLDGEVVSVRPDGVTSFHDLQLSISSGDARSIHYYAFDLLHLDGRDLADVPLVHRKEALGALLADSDGAVGFGDHVRGDGPRFYLEACRRGLEGVVSKWAEGRHVPRRSPEWRKVRCGARQEFVLCGYVPYAGDRRAVGALLLGVHDAAGRLRYAGRVGSGFDAETRADLARRLARVARRDAPFDEPVPATRDVRYADPVLVGEVAFTEWTADGRLRHPSFLGLREDKDAAAVVREAPARRVHRRDAGPRRRGTSTATAHAPLASGERTVEVAGVAITHPARVLWPDTGLTKRALAEHVERVALRMLPHVEGRPLSLLRCPSGVADGCFYQKHLEHVPAHVRTVEIAEHEGRRPCPVVNDAEGLVALVQMGTVEFHGWQATADSLERPDRVVLDLDPAPDVPFGRVVEAAREVRDRLRDVSLESFPATTGGKGLHVHVPLTRVHGWDEVKAFARALAEAMAEDRPDAYVATASKAKRVGRIFVDWLRNARGATAVVPYSPRARPGAPVATPLAWREVTLRLRPAAFTIDTLSSRLRRADPWREYESTAQRLPRP